MILADVDDSIPARTSRPLAYKLNTEVGQDCWDQPPLRKAVGKTTAVGVTSTRVTTRLCRSQPATKAAAGQEAREAGTRKRTRRGARGRGLRPAKPKKRNSQWRLPSERSKARGGQERRR